MDSKSLLWFIVCWIASWRSFDRKHTAMFVLCNSVQQSNDTVRTCGQFLARSVRTSSVLLETEYVADFYFSATWNYWQIYNHLKFVNDFFPSMSLCIHKMLIGFIVLRFVDGRGSDNGNGNANSRLIYSHEPLPTWLVVRYVMEFHIFDYESIHLHWQRGENRIDLTFKNVFFHFFTFFLLHSIECVWKWV